MQKPSLPSRRSQGERTDATRAALIAASRVLFEKQGFAATGTPEIVAAAQVTRGALYHHFADKTALFYAVCQQVAQEVANEIELRTRHSRKPLNALVNGANAYFTAMAAAGRARLLLLEAPAVFSAEQLMALSDTAGLGALKEGLADALTNSDHIEGNGPVPLHELSVVLSAAFDRAALAIARGEAAGPYQQAIRLLLSRLVA